MKKPLLFLLTATLTFMTAGSVLAQQVPTPNCTPQGSHATLTWWGIKEVSTTGATQNFTNNQGGSLLNPSWNAYTDYSSQYQAEAPQGSTFTLNATAFASDQNNWAVWIDWNQDGDFNGPNETIYVNQNNPQHVLSITVNVPQNAPLGYCRIRIISGDNTMTFNNPCQTTGMFEPEDYAVKVTDGGGGPPPNSGCQQLDAGVITGIDGICERNPFQLNLTGNSSGSGYSYQWQKRQPAGSGPWADILNGTSTTLNVSNGIAMNTDYRFIITCNADDSKDTTEIFTVNAETAPQVNNIIVDWQPGNLYKFRVTGAIGDNANYSWNFGDGTGSQDSTPIHRYATSGNYPVKVIVSNDCGADSTTVKLNYNTGIENMISHPRQLSLYPNPAGNTIIIDNKSPYKMKSVTVYNLLGQSVYRQSINYPRLYKLEVSNLPTGVYNLKIKLQNGQAWYRKFVKK